MFSHYLAAKLSDRIAAIAPVVGGMADPFYREFRPEKPVSVFIIQGMSDPLVPYMGGAVARGTRGRIIPTERAAALWVEKDGCDHKPSVGELPKTDPTGGFQVKWSRWSGGRDNTEVLLYAIEGGGHTWPGGSQFLPVFFVGRVCQDFDATEAIWEFFKSHPRP
jgi:polyhydroxybutyrate depolymerase